ncbi:MAG: M23 family metallopeptidase, partial [Nitrospirota bacterium]
MKDFGYKTNGKSRMKSFAVFLGIIIIIVALTYGIYKLFFIQAPLIEGTESFNLLSANKTITLKTKNLKSIDIFITQNSKQAVLLKDTSKNPEKTYTLTIKPKDLGLTDGPANVTVNAASGIFKKAVYEINTIIDTVPPRLEVLKAPEFIDQGGAGFAILRAENADSVFVRLDGYIFRAFKTAPGADSKSMSNYLVLFAVPFDAKESSVLSAVAEDSAGNQKSTALPTRLKIKKFTTSNINIDDSFINKVIYPLLNEPDASAKSDPVSAFKKINEDWRKINVSKLIEISRKTEPKILWTGSFLQTKNSKVMASYGDIRNFFYKGQLISKSVHLGYDMASTENALVEAANSGIIRFTGDLGIYGNTVVIDHGLGLMSIYGHLSMITAKEGQKVAKGDVIGKTGSTGLAGGDHL